MYKLKAGSQSKNSGFTLIELSMVIAVSTLLLIGLMKFISVYQNAYKQEQAARVVKNGETVMARFYDIQGRYPCPAKILPKTDPNFGMEDCDTITTVTGARVSRPGQAPADTDDVVMVGMLPLRAKELNDNGAETGTIIQLTGLIEKNELIQTSLIDPWNDFMTYAVTKSMTKKKTFDSYRGTVRITDEIAQADTYGRDTGGTNRNAHYAIISHGEDRMCGINADTGTIDVASDATYTWESKNCGANSTFIAALQSDNNAAPGSYYDDRIAFATRVPVSLWSQMQIGGVATENLATMTTGNVGIRNTKPSEKLEVGNWQSVVAGTMPEADSTIQVNRATTATQICDTVGTSIGKCITPKSFTTLGCVAGEYLRGIKIIGTGTNSQFSPTCTALTVKPTANVNCDNPVTGVKGFLTGITTDGTVTCGLRPKSIPTGG